MNSLPYLVWLQVRVLNTCYSEEKIKNFHKILEKSRNHAIIMHRDKSLSPFLLESAWLLETHRKPKLILLYWLLWKHKTVATLKPIRGVSLFGLHKWRWNHVATSFWGCRFLFSFFFCYFLGGERVLFLCYNIIKNKMNKGDLYGIQIWRN